MNYSKIKQIINCVETDNPNNDYDEISLLHDGPGNILQVTLGVGLTEFSGDLKKLLQLYVENKGEYADQLQPYIAHLGKQPSLATDKNFLDLLKIASKEDQIMRDAQDTIFDELYFDPAVKFFKDNGFTTNLALLVIYDSYTQSGQVPSFLRNKFPELVPAKGGDEKTWIKEYVDVRNDWLYNHSNTAIHNSAYRTRTYQKLIKDNNWDLTGPIQTLNGCVVPA